MMNRITGQVVVVLGLAATVPAGATSELLERIDETLDGQREALVELRRDLHRHPEVSGHEERTAGVVAERLRKLGFEVTTGVGGHGVVGLLKAKRPGPLVAFRADMDAVPSSDPDPVSFRSENEGVRHICGHDIHTTIGLALAAGFAAVRDELPGSVMLIFQPAEENATGARAMIADGAVAEPRPDAIYAYHTAPMPVGQLITTDGTLMAWRDQAEITIGGEGELAAAAKRLRGAIEQLATIEPRQATAPTSGDFLFVQTLEPARTANGEWSLRAIITTASDPASASAKARIEAELEALEGQGFTTTLDYQKKWVAGVTNDPRLAIRAMRSARSVLGDEAVGETEVVVPMFSEDFGSFQQEVPGVMFFLGVSNPEKGWIGMPHSPGYVADEESIFVGARAMAAVLLDFLSNPRS